MKMSNLQEKRRVYAALRRTPGATKLLDKPYVVGFQRTRQGAIHIGNRRGKIGSCAHLAAAGRDKSALTFEHQKHRVMGRANISANPGYFIVIRNDAAQY